VEANSTPRASIRVTTPDNVKFPDNSMTLPWRSAALLPMLSVTHIMLVLVLLSVEEEECNSAWSETKMKCTNSAKSRMDANMQLTMNSFRPLFPDTSLTFSKIPDISLTAVKFPGISRFSSKWSPCSISILEENSFKNHSFSSTKSSRYQWQHWQSHNIISKLTQNTISHHANTAGWSLLYSTASNTT